MRHFLSYIEESIKQNWSKPAITNYGAKSYSYAEVAAGITKLHLYFKRCGIVEGDHIAICARNSAEWCITFLAIASYKAVAVPLLADFLPANVIDLT